MKILIAEDDNTSRLVLSATLTKLGYEVKAVNNGRSAWEAWQEDELTIVISDWMMPELDGPETCRRLKSNPETAAIPVIFLTAKSQEAEIQRGLSLGAAGYVTKPFDALTLGQHVKDIVSKNHS